MGLNDSEDNVEAKAQWDRLVAPCLNGARAIFRRRGLDHDTVEDLMSEVMVSSFRSVGRIQSVFAICKYVQTIALNKLNDHFRKRNGTVGDVNNPISITAVVGGEDTPGEDHIAMQ